MTLVSAAFQTNVRECPPQPRDVSEGCDSLNENGKRQVPAWLRHIAQSPLEFKGNEEQNSNTNAFKNVSEGGLH